MVTILESTENKQLLWGVLMEEGIFDTIPKNVTLPEVQRVFETTLHNISISNPNASLIDLNRKAIESLAILIPEIKYERKQLVTADDIRNYNRYDIDNKLREKEAETRAYLEKPRPRMIDFADKNVIRRSPPDIIDITSMVAENVALSASLPITLSKPSYSTSDNVGGEYGKGGEGGGGGAGAGAGGDILRKTNTSEYDETIDSPLCDDINKLISDRIAMRERDLIEITNRILPKGGNQARNYDAMIIRSPAPSPAPAPVPSVSQSQVNKVRFSDDITIEHNSNNTELSYDSNPQIELDDIYSKLKRKSQPTQPTQPTQPDVQPNDKFQIEMNDRIAKLEIIIYEMKSHIDEISKKQNEIVERFLTR